MIPLSPCEMTVQRLFLKSVHITLSILNKKGGCEIVKYLLQQCLFAIIAAYKFYSLYKKVYSTPIIHFCYAYYCFPSFVRLLLAYFNPIWTGEGKMAP